ncbi:MAG: phosphatidic acid phosphatase [Caldicoprobacterales bacterium]|jgi:membrane-associated phospholipid phosphatase
MDLLKKLWRKYRHFTFILVIVALNLMFNWLKVTVAPRYQMASEIDNSIPFLKGFVIPYLLWFVYIIAVLMYLGLKSQKEFRQLSTFIIAGQIISMVIYFLFPNGQNLKPAIMSNDIFSRMILTIYRNHTFTYAAPSIHVLYSLAAHIGIGRYKPFSKIKLLPVLSFLFILTAVLSTLFIKQHSVKDVFFGVLLSAVLYFIIYKDKPEKGNLASMNPV